MPVYIFFCQLSFSAMCLDNRLYTHKNPTKQKTTKNPKQQQQEENKTKPNTLNPFIPSRTEILFIGTKMVFVGFPLIV